MQHLSFLLIVVLMLGNTRAADGQHATQEAYDLGVQGIEKMDEQAYEEAIDLFRKARNLDPANFDYTFEIGRAYLASGNAKKAERYLFDLQYHENVRPELFLVLAEAYATLNENRKNPDAERKKELDALRYGIATLPESGLLYLELGKRFLEMDRPAEALTVWEKGTQNAPSFPANHFWLAKMLATTGNSFRAWLHAETFFNMTDNAELMHTLTPIILEHMKPALELNGFNSCVENIPDVGPEQQLLLRTCLEETSEKSAPELLRALQNRWRLLASKNWMTAYVAFLLRDSHRDHYVQMVKQQPEAMEQFKNWNYWNRMTLE